MTVVYHLFMCVILCQNYVGTAQKTVLCCDIFIQEEEELINDWTPQPLVLPTNLPKDRPLEDNPVVSG